MTTTSPSAGPVADVAASLAVPTERWVLGHRVQPIPTGGDYALLSIVTPAHTEGPPPHYHDDAAEVLHVIDGQLDVMVDGTWHVLTSGRNVIAPAGAVHTFRNPTDRDTHWITSFGPAGFEGFFEEFGVPVDDDGARAASLAPDLIGRVLEGCGRYGMIVVLPEDGGGAGGARSD